MAEALHVSELRRKVLVQRPTVRGQQLDMHVVEMRIDVLGCVVFGCYRIAPAATPAQAAVTNRRDSTGAFVQCSRQARMMTRSPGVVRGDAVLDLDFRVEHRVEISRCGLAMLRAPFGAVPRAVVVGHQLLVAVVADRCRYDSLKPEPQLEPLNEQILELFRNRPVNNELVSDDRPGF